MTPDTSDDRLLDGRVILRQPTSGYRAAVDPVLLAAAVRAGPRVLDAGCGTGAAMFCLAARRPEVVVTGLEVQPQPAAWAREGIALNHLEQRATVVAGDVTARAADLGPTFGAPFDVVMTNPPYGAGGTPPPDAALAMAHMEKDVTLAAWIKACLGFLKPGGRLVMIHRADRLSEILGGLRGPAGDIHIFPVFPKAGEAARRVIVDAGKGRRSPDTLLPGLVLHEDGGAFTAAADRVLRSGQSLRP